MNKKFIGLVIALVIISTMMYFFGIETVNEALKALNVFTAFL